MSNEKTAGLPSFLKGMTKKEFGVTKITKWPKDSRLVSRLEMHQAGKQFPLAPKSNRNNAEWVDSYRSAHASPPEGSTIDRWKKNREMLKTGAPMDRELAGAVIKRWEDGLPVAETTFYKAASVLGIDPQGALREARFFTHLDRFLLEKRAMSATERKYFSAAAGYNPHAMIKTAAAHGFSPDELILEALRERDFVPDLEKLALLMQDPSGAGLQSGGAEPPPAVDGAVPGPQDPNAVPKQGVSVQQQPQARFRPSPTAPEQIPGSPDGNLDALLQEMQGMAPQQAQENGGLPPSGAQPQGPPPNPNERVMQVAPDLDAETAQRYGEKLVEFEQTIQMAITDPKQMVKFVKELQKVDGKRIDDGIKAFGEQLEQEQAAEMGVNTTPTVNPQPAKLGPPKPKQPPGAAPGAQEAQPQPQDPMQQGATKVAYVARALARVQAR